MAAKMYFIGLSLLLNSRLSAQQTDRAILLKDISRIIMPDTPNYVYATVGCNDQVQIIAIAQAQSEKWPLAAVITSRLGKGKVLINGIRPATGVLILSRDVSDSVQRDNLEIFIRNGGTLIFGSPVADKRDYWFTCISAATTSDLAAFFDKWQIPITEKARASVKVYPTWLPDELK